MEISINDVETGPTSIIIGPSSVPLRGTNQLKYTVESLDASEVLFKL